MVSNVFQKKEPWYQDSILDESITLNGLTYVFENNPKSILITGATGFFGSHITSEVLKQTQAKVYVLVRAENKESALDRIRKKMEEFCLWEEKYADRIFPLIGEFSKEYLGLPVEQWDFLAGELDVIYHNGAEVNFLLPYNTLYTSNVKPTVELIKLAVTSKVKRLIYVSLVNVFNIPKLKSREIVYEEQPTHSIDSPLGYIKSKWTSDRLVQEAGKRGVPVSIFRLPYVGGDMTTGYLNKKDFFWIILKACLKLGLAPNVGEAFFAVPADFLSKAFVYISSGKQSVGRCYSTISSEAVTWNDIFKAFISLGHKMEIVEGEVWRESMIQFLKSNTDKSIHPLLSFVRLGLPFKSPAFDNTNFIKALEGSGIECPSFSVMAKAYNTYISEKGLLFE